MSGKTGSKLTIYVAIIFSSVLLGQLCQSQTLDKARTLAQINRTCRKTGWKFDKDWKSVDDPTMTEAWGRAFEKALNNKELKAASTLITFDQLKDRAVAVATDKQFKSGFGDGIEVARQNLMKQYSVSNESYHFCSVKQTEFGPAALMRLMDAEGGCNYHLWYLKQTPAGKTIGVDMYVYLSGESLADTMRRIVILSMPKKDDRTMLQKLVGVERKFLKSQLKLVSMIEAQHKGDFKSVLATYKELPKSLQQERFLMFLRMTSAMQIDDAEYLLALEDMQKLFPGDTSADLISIDMHFMNKKFDKMHESLDRLEKQIGPDSHLYNLRAGGLIAEGKLNEAIKVLDKAIALEPDLEESYWTQVETALGAKDLDKVNTTLKGLVKVFGYNQFDFSGQEIYKPFLNSAQYEDFVEFLKNVNK